MSSVQRVQWGRKWRPDPRSGGDPEHQRREDQADPVVEVAVDDLESEDEDHLDGHQREAAHRDGRSSRAGESSGSRDDHHSQRRGADQTKSHTGARPAHALRNRAMSGWNELSHHVRL